MTQVRRHAPLGMENRTAPLLRNDQVLPRSASLAVARAARAAATFLSKNASNSLRDLGSGGGVKGLPPGDMSKESCLRVSTAQPGMLARWLASQPMLPDFSCGFQENFSSGTRSSVLRVFAI